MVAAYPKENSRKSATRMPKNTKTEEVSTINLTHFYSMPDKGKAKIAGIIKKIDDKPTPYGTAKRFKGDVVLEGDSVNYRTKNIYFPDSVRDAILEGARKLGKWTAFEFVITVTKAQAATDNAATVYSFTFNVAPRNEMPRVLALLES